MKCKLRTTIIAALIIAFAVIGTTYAVNQYNISQLQSDIKNISAEIDSDNEEVANIDETKESLHIAADNLRKLSTTSDSLSTTVSSLSSAWSEIDIAQTNLRSKITENKNTLTQLSAELEELERKQGKFLGVFTTTAYWSGEGGNITSTGKIPQVGRTIAVDPSVIPYGTKLHIIKHNTGEDLGYRIAEDCGGAIKGNRLDLFLGTDSECRAWGRQPIDVYIVE